MVRMRWQKVFIHTRLSRAYLAYRYCFLVFVSISQVTDRAYEMASILSGGRQSSNFTATPTYDL